MHWTIIVGIMREVFMLAYAIFVICIFVRWILELGASRFTLRDWLGSIGLATGICSVVLYALFLFYLWMENRLIAHGSTLWLYYYAGFYLAIVGIMLSLAGHNWVRRSSIVISLVMVFQWWGRMIVGLKAESIITVAMFVSLVVVGILVLGNKFIFRRSRTP